MDKVSSAYIMDEVSQDFAKGNVLISEAFLWVLQEEKKLIADYNELRGHQGYCLKGVYAREELRVKEKSLATQDARMRRIEGQIEFHFERVLQEQDINLTSTNM
ncbi:hypothetical protein HAX54_000571 [Datura stramonium]|uniref:Uncharacterized protein n=1 Tax=Datura stramonium TaxID=4076 RepID=A0ABS8T194_DATST|nr:hypothetical protein [Datura stramonium]